MITYHKNRQQGLSIIKSLIFAPSEMEDFIYIYVKNILGCKLSKHFTNNQKMYFFPASEIYVHIYIRFRPPYPLNLECCILSCSP